MQIGHRSTFTGRLRGGDRLACDQAADQGTYRGTKERAGVSLLGGILETGVGILDAVEPNGELAGFAVVPAEHLIVRLAAVADAANSVVGLHTQGLRVGA